MTESQNTVVLTVGMFPWRYVGLADYFRQMVRAWMTLPETRVVQQIYWDPVYPAQDFYRLKHALAGWGGPAWHVVDAEDPTQYLGLRGEPLHGSALSKALQGRVMVYGHSYVLETLQWLVPLLAPEYFLYEALENVCELEGQRVEIHRAMVDRAHCVVTISDEVESVVGAMRPKGRIVRWGSAVDTAFWQAASHQTRRWSFGFVGHLKDWIDWTLLDAVAARYADESIVLIGPVAADCRHALDTLVQTRPNVEWLGPQLYGDLPALVGQVEVALLPRTHSAISRGSDPLKVYEYLAAGKPVVSSLDLGDNVNRLVRIASDSEDFVAACGAALNDVRHGTDLMASERAGMLQQKTWQARARTLWNATVAEGIIL